MFIKPFSTKFSNIGDQIFLRTDPKYRLFWDKKFGITITQKRFGITTLKDVMIPVEKKILRKGKLAQKRIILELDDIESKTSRILNERKLSEIGSDKLDFKDCDMVFCKLRPYLGKIVLNEPSKNYIGTTEWIPLRLDKKKVNPLFLKYLLLLEEFLLSYSLILGGKEHPRISVIDLRNMKIPYPPLNSQNILAKKIKEIETDLFKNLENLPDSIQIIDDVFSEHFDYDKEKYEQSEKNNIFQISFSQISKSFLLRNTVKYQHKKYDYLENNLEKHKTISLKKICSSEIHRGVQPEYVPNGEILVVKTLNLKHESLDFSEADNVSKNFYNLNKEAQIQKNDILISSTGQGRGKVDIYDLDKKAIADTHISIVRLKSVNPYYVLYFLRSLLGKFQLEKLEIAIKGTPEIYADNLEKFKIIDLSSDCTDEIVNKISSEISALKKRKSHIDKLKKDLQNEFYNLLKLTQNK